MKVTSSNGGFYLTAVLFLASGLSSLIYQVVWTRMLVLVFGSTTFATSTVLAIFMGGLALGSYVAGRLADKVKRPFLCYGILEGAIGLWALLVPLLFPAASPLFQIIWREFHPNLLVFSLLRALMVLVILILPTACMGATLPVISKFVTSSLEIVGRRVGLLYSLNTLGAVVGAAAAGFWLIPTFGLSMATLIAASINVVLCLTVLALSVSVERNVEEQIVQVPTVQRDFSKDSGRLSGVTFLVVFTFAISGAVAMVYEVGWTRALLMVIGSSTYAFSVMLCSFLVGIFVGSFVCAKHIDRAKNPVAWFAVLEIGLCLFGVLSLINFNYLPWWNLQINSFWPESPVLSLAARLFLSACILMPLTLCLGASFPAVVKACTGEFEAVGRSVGTLYSVNTLGAIVGAMAAGFVLVPACGVERMLTLAAVINLVLGAALMLSLKETSLLCKSLIVVLSLPVLYFSCQPLCLWDKRVMLMGQSERRRLIRENRHYDSFTQWADGLSKRNQIAFWNDGPCSTVGILHWTASGGNSLVTNGHVDASDGVDKTTQALIACLPLIWKPDARDIAVVGWGSGMSVGDVTLFPVSSITAIELEPAVVTASSFFHHINHSPEKDPRLHLEINDGRNYLLLTDKRFDVIISEPSNPWQAGVCNLFTREYFQNCQDRLNPGGILSLWLQTAEVPPENVRGILASLQSVFPYVAAFRLNSSNLALLASQSPLQTDYSSLVAAFKKGPVADELRSVAINSPEKLASLIEISPDALSQLAAGATFNVDDTNRLEYEVGLTYENLRFYDKNKKLRSSNIGQPWKLLKFSNYNDVEKALLFAEIGRQAYLDNSPELGLAWVGESLAVAPTTEGFRIAGIALWHENRRTEAHAMWQQGLLLEPGWPDVFVARGVAEWKDRQIEAARADLRRAFELAPSYEPARLHLAETYSPSQSYQLPDHGPLEFFQSFAKKQDPEEVEKLLMPLVNSRFTKEHPEVLYLLGQAEYQLGRKELAVGYLKRLLAVSPDSIMARRVLGCLMLEDGHEESAAYLWGRSFEIANQVYDDLSENAEEFLGAGKEKLAVNALTRCLELKPSQANLSFKFRELSKGDSEATEAVSVLDKLFR